MDSNLNTSNFLVVFSLNTSNGVKDKIEGYEKQLIKQHPNIQSNCIFSSNQNLNIDFLNIKNQKHSKKSNIQVNQNNFSFLVLNSSFTNQNINLSNNNKVAQQLNNSLGSYCYINYSEQKQSISINIDSIGQERIFYHISPNNELVISDKLKHILQYSNNNLELDANFMQQMLVFGYPIDDSTSYTKVKRVKNNLVFPIQNQLIKDCSQKSDFIFNFLTEETNFKNITEQIEENLHARLQAIYQKNSNLGLMCSGGLDSRLILSLLYKNKLKSPCYTFGQDEFVGKKVSRLLSEATKNDYHFVNSYELYNKDPFKYVKQAVNDNEYLFFIRHAVNLPFFETMKANGVNTAIAGYGGELCRLKPNFGDHQALISSNNEAYQNSFFEKMSLPLRIANENKNLPNYLNKANSFSQQILNKHLILNGNSKDRAYKNFFNLCMRNIFTNLTGNLPSGVELTAPFLSNEYISLAKNISLKKKKNGSLHKNIIQKNYSKLLWTPDSNTLVPIVLPDSFHKIGRLGIKVAKKFNLIKHYHISDADFTNPFSEFEQDIIHSKDSYFSNFFSLDEYKNISALHSSLHFRLLNLELYYHFHNN